MLSLSTLAGGPAVTDLDQLMERQDWLDEMRSESQKPNKKDDLPVFKSVCHGQPWAGNVYFRYEVDSNGEKVPVDAIFTGQSLSEALIFASANPRYENRLFIQLPVQCMKIPSSDHRGEHAVYKNCSECQKQYQLGIFMH